MKQTSDRGPVLDNAHLAGIISELSTLSDLFLRKGVRPKFDPLTKMGIGETPANTPFNYGGIIITIFSDPGNKNRVSGSDIDIPDKAIEPIKRE